MKILVTGGTGMLGHNFLEKYCLDYSFLFTGRKKQTGKEIEQKIGAKFLHLDLAEKEKLARACQGVDGVVHCAALSSPWGNKKDFWRVNIQGTANLLSAAEKAGVRKFVYISTPSVYFDFRDRRLIKETETLPETFCNHYAWSKAEAEKLVRKSSVRSVILRPRGIIGPHDSAIAPRILRSVYKNVLRLPSSNNPTIDMTYVDNVADAIHLALLCSAPSGEIYNITNEEPTPVKDILNRLFEVLELDIEIRTLPYGLVAPLLYGSETIRRLLPFLSEPILTRYSGAMLHYQQTLDISKAKSQLGFSPQVSLHEGLRRYGKWYAS